MSRRLYPTRGWWAALALVAGVGALAASPPALGAESGALVRAAFAAVCHQIPERSVQVGGTPWALCHRCSGVVAGLVAGLLAALAVRGRGAGRLVAAPPLAMLGVALVPMSADWLLGALHLWANTPVSRVLTGGLFGLSAGALLAVAFCRVSPPSSLPTP